jgi:hypothetical protein
MFDKNAYMRQWKKENKDKVNSSRRASRKRNPEKTRNNRLKHKYGITLEEYNKMFDEQNGCCFICKVSQEQLPYNLCVDHRHRDGLVRKLLCKECNSVAGLMKENTERLRMLASYLEGYEYV